MPYIDYEDQMPQRVLAWIQAQHALTGRMPTLEEMMVEFGWEWERTALFYCYQLYRAGHIQRRRSAGDRRVFEYYIGEPEEHQPEPHREPPAPKNEHEWMTVYVGWEYQ